MKKITLILGTFLLFAVAGTSLSSCATETSHNEHAHAHYQCPMDCEKGKQYEEAGTCPVCKMDLKEVE